MDGSSGESSRGVDSGMTVVAVGCTTSGSASIGAVSTVTTIGVGVGIGISVGSGVGVAGIDVGVAGTDVGVDITVLAVVSMGLLEVGSCIAGDPHAIVPAIKDRITQKEKHHLVNQVMFFFLSYFKVVRTISWLLGL